MNNLSKDKNLHEGHRKRVLKTYSRIDLDSLSPHQVLEYILFYCVPRGDVNPLAHRLLNKYNTVQNVLEADVNELKKVYGINETTALKITGLTKIFNYYMGSQMSKKYFFSTTSDMCDYCEELLRFQKQEVFYCIALDASFHVINKRQLSSGSSSLVGVETREICNFINESKASNVLFAHNHPGGYATPSPNDEKGNEVLKNLVQYMGVGYIDHIIVGCDGVYSINNKMQIRLFSTNENIKEFADAIKNIKE